MTTAPIRNWEVTLRGHLQVSLRGMDRSWRTKNGSLALWSGTLGLTPSQRAATVGEASISWNYTTVLSVAFLLLAALLLWRFFTTGGMDMLRMMGGSQPDPHADDSHDETTHAHLGAPRG